MLKKGSKLNSILTGSCPKCQEESMYVNNNMYNPNYTIKMNESCSHCGTHYKIEPSFFYGAMYVSYALTVAIGVAAFIISKVFIGLGLIESFVAIILSLIVLMPITARIARNIYINMFVSYKPNSKDEKHID